MEISDILGLMGGLALFFYGMKMMSEGLEDAAGHRLVTLLSHLTDHKLKSILVGALITAMIHSSSAMTVMLIGFVNAKIMPLNRAVWVVMGANIGTTITGQMIALNIGAIAPVLAIVGVIMIVFIPISKMNIIGQIIGGCGLLFMGLEFMSLSMEPLQQSQVFIDFITTLSNPFLAILCGTIFTAIIQSSSASIGILQTLAMQGMIGLESASYVIFGFDIGTCADTLLASLPGCQNAKRLALFHVVFNLFGTCLFVIILHIFPIFEMIKAITPHSIAAQLANMHTLFNLITTMIVMFIDKYILKVIYKIIPIKNEAL